MNSFSDGSKGHNIRALQVFPPKLEELIVSLKPKKITRPHLCLGNTRFTYSHLFMIPSLQPAHTLPKKRTSHTQPSLATFSTTKKNYSNLKFRHINLLDTHLLSHLPPSTPSAHLCNLDF